jgi:ABC-type transporter Mla subunit MlaD
MALFPASARVDGAISSLRNAYDNLLIVTDSLSTQARAVNEDIESLKQKHVDLVKELERAETVAENIKKIIGVK